VESGDYFKFGGLVHLFRDMSPTRLMYRVCQSGKLHLPVNFSTFHNFSSIPLTLDIFNCEQQTFVQLVDDEEGRKGILLHPSNLIPNFSLSFCTKETVSIAVVTAST